MFFLTLFFSLLLVLSFFLIENTPTLEKISPFECGFASFSDVFGPFNVQFYFTALYFLVFDLELALILPVIPVLLSLGVFPLVIFFFLLLAMFLCVFYERMCFKLMYKNSY
jgi:NADH-quinone oxidoreductase subunit A